MKETEFFSVCSLLENSMLTENGLQGLETAYCLPE